MNKTLSKVLRTVIPLLVAAASVFVIAGYAASPQFHASTIASLDEKTGTVLELTAASAAASAAITLLPGDTATPIADKLAELSSYFLIVISAIYLEKYLTTITGYAAFMILIPAACILLAVNVFARKEMIRRVAWKLTVFGLAVALVIPASVRVSDMIDETYSASIQSTINAAIQTTDQIPADGEEEAETEESGGIRGFISGVKETVSGTGDSIKRVLNNFVNALAVMLVTSCLIPILVMLFFIWLTKILIGSDVALVPRRVPEGRPEERHEQAGERP
ncbi:MAG: hypothetical protein IJG40_07945 [Oscillospiraceae bacterium]|nr:hypothetical protein [Oscillospiraceae bacterium]